MSAGGIGRRSVLQAIGMGGLAALLLRPDVLLAQRENSEEFSWELLKIRAKTLADSPYSPPDRRVSETLAKMNYDQYRNIVFRHDRAFWKGEPFPFQMELFHSGYLYREPVHVHIVEDGQASLIGYDPSLFDFGPAEERVEIPPDAGYSGLRVRAPSSPSNKSEEFAVFQGASYFRSRAASQVYGLSARGLAVNTVQPGGEEFPAFRSFWVEKPAHDAKTITLYALLDSQSVSGAYRFVISHNHDTVMDIDCELYPRRELTFFGIAPFSSMYFFSPADHTRWDDFRPRVHDSDGLLMHTGTGDWIWRPIITGGPILYSAFSDKSPRGFGLMQRERGYGAYQDINAGYDNRPSAWVEPLSDWGEGTVDLIELPTNNEYADNIVAFWRPAQPMKAGASYQFGYRLSWVEDVPVKRNIATIHNTRAGKGQAPNSRYFIFDLAGGELYAEAVTEYWDYEVTASTGLIWAYTVAANPHLNGKRITIEFRPDGDKQADITFRVSQDGKPLAERFVYRWAP
jgi:glucans biosynthesis protein